MKKLLKLSALLLLLMVSTPSQAKSKAFVSDQVIVKFKPNLLSLQGFDRLLVNINATHIESSTLIPELKIISFKNQKIETVLDFLRSHPAIEYAEPNFIIHIGRPTDNNEDDDDPDWPFPWPPPGDGDNPWPIPWPPDDGDNPWPIPWPPKDGDKEDPAPLDPPDSFEPAEDPLLKKSWGVEKIGSAKAWEITPGSKDILVAVVDTGIDYNHEDLIYNVYRNSQEIPNNKIDDDSNGFIDDVIGWDFVHSDPLPFDDHSHGTHVSGTIGAVGNNGIGTSGVIQNVKILALKAFNANGEGEVATAIKALEYAGASGARVINNSWGDSTFSQALQDVIVALNEKNVVVVCAAGNDATNNDETAMYPANIESDNVISVAASTGSDKKAFFSNYGSQTVHIAAPGQGIYSTTPNNKYGNMDGTSMASPHVAGAAALVLSYKPELTPLKVRNLLMETVDDVKSFTEKVVSNGRLNIYKALKKLKE